MTRLQRTKRRLDAEALDANPEVRAVRRQIAAEVLRETFGAIEPESLTIRELLELLAQRLEEK